MAHLWSHSMRDLYGTGSSTKCSKVLPATHLCWGTSCKATLTLPDIGLSPRLRGNRPPDQAAALPLRSIPAPAGEPSLRSCSAHKFWVYPRACGGTALAPIWRQKHSGLSPRLRGNRAPSCFRPPFCGSIPAPAGEPVPRTWRPRGAAVYPRACGGTDETDPTANYVKGLSPRLRGNLLPLREGDPPSRSIPAPAGEPATGPRRSTSPTVYPRACGGTVSSRLEKLAWVGLSPRLRGNLAQGGLHDDSNGSIPAPAGEPPQGPNSLWYQ